MREQNNDQSMKIRICIHCMYKKKINGEDEKD